MRLISRLLRFNSELFASTFSYASTAVLKLASSLVLTRLLSPEAYGIFGILFSFLFMVELVSDVGSVGLLIRHARGGEPTFVHTVWTVRLIRSVINAGLIFCAAPVIAAIYQTPQLTSAFRVLSIWFLLLGAESMSFAMAQRDRRARISNYAELMSNAVMTVFVISAAHVFKNHFVLIYGALLQRALLAVSSHFFYRHIGVGIAFDRAALTDQFRFARFVLPSSILTIVLTQYDKVILLKLFDLATLGVYGIAGNMVSPVTGVGIYNARVVLYARCAEYFRSDRASAKSRYYSENRRLLALGVILPAALAGFAQLVVQVLYDPRYTLAGSVLQVLAIGAMVTAFQNASENLIVASGRTHAVLVANIVRVCSVIPASFIGYYLYGFSGFLWFNCAATLPPLAYYLVEQKRLGLLDARDELQRVGLALAVFVGSLLAARLLLHAIPAEWLHLGLRRHHA